eukprot:CAMPEP_0181355436 /NCGR_PEP_ID=MMETSP1106-20121128/3897_1 /TAXON_ID=81844 /ORGANISM="Mantoniella antarctica, Strain SL-175" /LENGTH=56 /DNA_ID=CAMNT_0023468173 /DNA_START=344 /DNA_END=510 /DNA_ORIENTATION=-
MAPANALWEQGDFVWDVYGEKGADGFWPLTAVTTDEGEGFPGATGFLGGVDLPGGG